MRAPTKIFLNLTETPTAEVRSKRNHGAPIYLKSDEIGGRMLRVSGKVTSKSLASRLALA
jgi:hypothetical protein